MFGMIWESWLPWALLSAVFAALTALLAKVGVEQVPSNLATAIRTTVILVMAWAFAMATHQAGLLSSVGRRPMLALVLSGMATGLSWLCYFRALSLGPMAKVAPIDKLSLPLAVLLAVLILGERLGPREIAGISMITAGALLMVWK